MEQDDEEENELTTLTSQQIQFPPRNPKSMQILRTWDSKTPEFGHNVFTETATYAFTWQEAADQVHFTNPDFRDVPEIVNGLK